MSPPPLFPRFVPLAPHFGAKGHHGRKYESNVKNYLDREDNSPGNQQQQMLDAAKEAQEVIAERERLRQEALQNNEKTKQD
ncbi:MAG: hypothetical protein QE263_01745 [Vampirovibrionales bacterium]|nr:hypothetical protein [Vampirovibrionales bacterium]